MGEGGCSDQLQPRDQPQSLGDVTTVYGPSLCPSRWILGRQGGNVTWLEEERTPPQGR